MSAESWPDPASAALPGLPCGLSWVPPELGWKQLPAGFCYYLSNFNKNAAARLRDWRDVTTQPSRPGTRACHFAEQCAGATSPALAAATVTLPLTGREREIALLVSQGLSNRDMAEAMSLSVRTVEGHIYRATVKAGVATRDELSSVLRQFD